MTAATHAGFAQAEHSAKLPAEKLNCTDKDLARLDCHLSSKNYDIRLLPKTVAWSDGTWHTVDPMPLDGKAIGWERAGFRWMNGRAILQFWLWDEGAGETKVESLHWYVAEFQKRKLKILSEGIVRKRRPEPMEVAAPAAAPVAATKASEKKAVVKRPKQKYLYDGWEPHFVRAAAGGVLEWQLSGQKKSFPKLKDDTEK